jgi:hypothetical protein
MLALRRAVLIAAVACALAFGQAQVSSGDIHGAVSDPTGAVIRAAKITATDSERGITRTAQSDESGNYRIPLLPPGAYRVRVEAAGFNTTIIERTEVRVGDTVVLPVQMTVGQVTTEVSVSAEIPAVEPERTQQSSTLQSQQILNLPINRRNYLDFALLTPGVAETNDMVDGTDFRVVQAPQSGLSFGGSNGRGNAFMVDGVENYVNSGGVRPSISQEAVSEFQVNRNSYSAEFGGGFGGAVNIVSRSGSNDFHGNLFGFLRNRAIQARNYFDPNRDGSAYTRYQAGATLGGPIVRDRTMFFLAFERLDRNETSFVPILEDRSAFSRLTASQEQLLGFLNNVPQLRPLGAGLRSNLTTTTFPGTIALFNRNSGNFPFAEETNLFSFRLDHKFTQDNMLFIRGNMARTDSTAAQLGALLAYNRGRNIGQDDNTIMLNDTWVITDRLVSETRAMFGHYKLDITTIDPFGPQIDISGFGLFGREIFLPSRIIERHYQLMQTLTYSSGRHALKFGADINPVRDNVHTETFFSGRFSFGEVVPLAQLLISATGDPNFPATLIGTLNAAGQGQLAPSVTAPITALQAYNLGLPTFYQQGFGDPNWLGWSKRYNFFVNDTWRVHPRLTLNLGARYELEVNERVLGTDPNNIAPRVGLAWTLTEDAKTVLRAGYGMFYSPNNLQIANVADALSGSYIQQVFVPLTGIPGLNNRLTGRPLTSADIYGTLLRQGVIGQRTIARDDLLQFGLAPNPALPGAVIFGAVDDWRNPWSQQTSLELERGIGSFAISAAYNFNRGARIPRVLNRNLAYGPRRPNGQPTFVQLNPRILQLNILEPTANSFYHAGILQITKRFSRGFSLNAHYTFSKAIDETTDFNTDFSPHDQLNARAERALSSFDQRHRFVGNAVFVSNVHRGGVFMTRLIEGWTFSPIVIASSGRPFNVLTGVDNMGDNQVNTHRPLGAGRNIGRGPGFFTLDARLSRKFRLGSEARNLEFIAEGFNLLNRTNFRSVNNVVGPITVEQLPRPLEGRRGIPTTPLAFTSAFDPRQFQFGLKLNF